jgi:serine protease Do
MPRLLDFERLARIVVGLIVRQVRADGADAVVVASVGADTPAAQAGCKPGDRVLAVNGRPVQQLPDYQVPMLAMAPGSEVLLRLLREGREVEVRLTVRARPKPDGAALAWRLLGMRLAPITPDLARQMRLEVDVGLAVTELDPKGPAARLGLRRGDVIFHIGRWYVTNLEGIGAILEDAQPGDALRVGILRGNVRAWGSLEVPKVDISPPPGPERVRT